jgi:hypothetical protein
MNSAAIHEPTINVADDYRYKRFTTSLLLRDLRFRKNAAAPGNAFPQFELFATDGSVLVNESVFGDKPVIFIFGSMTCPMTARAAAPTQELYDEFSDRVKFIMLYVREAHPGEYFAQAETIEEKLDYARELKDFYGIHWTVAADSVDGGLHRALDPKPNSAFLMDKNGTILFRSLWASDYRALRKALDAAATGQSLSAEQSTKMLRPVAEAMGYVHAVMKRGGPRAVRELWLAGFPMALAGTLADLIPSSSPVRRGIAAVSILASVTAAALTIVTFWILD